MEAKKGDLISFKISMNADAKLLEGVVDYKDQLGWITLVDGIQYELSKLIDIKIIKFSKVVIEHPNKYSKIVIEETIQFDSEDGGAAKIANISGPNYEQDDTGFFIRLQSWDERAWNEKTKDKAHPMVKELSGKKIRITIEVIE